MTLQEALKVLCEVHTKDDDQLGYVILYGATPRLEHDHSRYMEAWNVVRWHALGEKQSVEAQIKSAVDALVDRIEAATGIRP